MMIRRIMTVWWPKARQINAKRTFTHVQQLACLCITEAISTKPTASMESLINLTNSHNTIAFTGQRLYDNKNFLKTTF